jgi:hypothetical protein
MADGPSTPFAGFFGRSQDGRHAHDPFERHFPDDALPSLGPSLLTFPPVDRHSFTQIARKKSTLLLVVSRPNFFFSLE